MYRIVSGKRRDEHWTNNRDIKTVPKRRLCILSEKMLILREIGRIEGQVTVLDCSKILALINLNIYMWKPSSHSRFALKRKYIKTFTGLYILCCLIRALHNPTLLMWKSFYLLFLNCSELQILCWSCTFVVKVWGFERQLALWCFSSDSLPSFFCCLIQINKRPDNRGSKSHTNRDNFKIFLHSCTKDNIKRYNILPVVQCINLSVILFFSFFLKCLPHGTRLSVRCFSFHHNFTII